MQHNDFEYVGFWPRVGASIIDAIIVFIITTPPLVAIYDWSYFTDLDQPFIAGPADLLISWILPAIGVILFWLYKQATPGKMAVSARVVDARTGDTLTVRQSIGRYLAYFVAILPLLLGIIWVAFDPRKQAGMTSWLALSLSGLNIAARSLSGSRPDNSFNLTPICEQAWSGII